MAHEIGHFFGLYHTFHEGGAKCVKDNDRVKDTAIHGAPSSGCPRLRNSCPDTKGDGAGYDPIWNLMDYSDDACMYSFSRDQKSRMHLQLQMYKKVRPCWRRGSFLPSMCARCLEGEGGLASSAVRGNRMYPEKALPGSKGRLYRGAEGHVAPLFFIVYFPEGVSRGSGLQLSDLRVLHNHNLTLQLQDLYAGALKLGAGITAPQFGIHTCIKQFDNKTQKSLFMLSGNATKKNITKLAATTKKAKITTANPGRRRANAGGSSSTAAPFTMVVEEEFKSNKASPPKLTVNIKFLFFDLTEAQVTSLGDAITAWVSAKTQTGDINSTIVKPSDTPERPEDYGTTVDVVLNPSGAVKLNQTWQSLHDLPETGPTGNRTIVVDGTSIVITVSAVKAGADKFHYYWTQANEGEVGGSDSNSAYPAVSGSTCVVTIPLAGCPCLSSSKHRVCSMYGEG